MEDLQLQGKRYISSKQAAKLAGYSTDYIGQLCRAGKLDCTRVGRVWYVTQVSILDHKKASEEIVATQTEQLKKEVVETMAAKNALRSAKVSPYAEEVQKGDLLKYSADDAPLIPELRKQPVVVVPAAVVDSHDEITFTASPITHAEISNSLVIRDGRLPFMQKEVARKSIAFALMVSVIFGTAYHSDSAFGQDTYRKLSRWSQSVALYFNDPHMPSTTQVAGVYSGAQTAAQKVYLGISSLFGKKTTNIAQNVTATTTTTVVTPVVTPVAVATSTTSVKVAQAAPSTRTIVNNKTVVEKTTERVVVGDISRKEVEEKIQQLGNKLSSQMYMLSTGGGGSVTNIYQQIAGTNRIDVLSGVDVSGSTWSGGSISGTNISNSTFTGTLAVQGDVTVSGSVALASSSPSDTTLKLYTDGTDLYWSGSSISSAASSWSTSGGNVYRTTGNVGVGTTSPYEKLSIAGNAVISGTTTASVFVSTSTATSTFGGGVNLASGCFAVNGTCVGSGNGSGTVETGTAGQLAYYSSTGTTVTGTSTLFVSSTQNVGIGTTSPYAKLSVAGSVVGEYFTATSSTASTFPYASSTAFTTSNLFVGSLTGPLQAINGLVSASSTLSIAYGGTGITTTPNYGQILVGNSSGGYTLTATSSLGINSLSGGTAGMLSAWTSDTTLTATGTPTVAAITATSTATSTFVGGIQTDLLRVSSTTASSTFANGINLTAGCFSVNGVCAGTGNGTVNSGTTGQLAFYSSSGTTISGTSTLFALDEKIGIGTTSPYAKLSVAGTVVAQNFVATSTTATSTFAGGLDVGNGGLVYDLNSGITSITALETGSMRFDTDAGIVTWMDLPISSSASGIVNSYTANLDGQPALTIYGEADGSGNANKVRVAIGTTTPSARLTVWASTTAATGVAFNVVDFASTTLFNVLDSGNVGIGTTTPYAKLSVEGNSVIGGSQTASYFIATSTTATSTFAGAFSVGSTTPDSASVFSVGTSSPLFVVTQSGKIGIGTASPTTGSVYKMTVSGGANITGIVNSGTSYALTGVNALTLSGSNFQIANSSTWQSLSLYTNAIEQVRLDASGNFGIGTTSPYAKLSVAGTVVGQNFVATSTTATSTFAGGLNVGSGGLVYDLNSGITSINALETGSMRFDTDGGQLTWTDLPVASSTSGVVNSYTAELDGQPMITVYGISDGVGGASSTRVAIGTTSPSARLTVWSSGMTNDTRLFDVVNNSSTTLFTVLENGNVGVGTTTPYAKLSVEGDVFVGGTLTVNALNSTSTATSTFAGDILARGLSAWSYLTAPFIAATSTTATSTFAGAVSIGSTTPDTTTLFSVGTSSPSLFVSKTNGYVGVGTVSPTSAFEVKGDINQRNSSGNLIFSVANSGSHDGLLKLYDTGSVKVNLVAEGVSYFNGGNFGIGTTSPYSMLSVAGQVVAQNYVATSTTATSTFAGGLDVGSGGLIYDLNSGVTSITALETGAMRFDTDAGIVSWVDLPVASSTSGLIQSYSAQLDGQPMLTIYGISDGVGGASSTRVAIGTTTPAARLTVWSSGMTNDTRLFDVINSASSTMFTVLENGNVGIATTTPYAKLSVAGTVVGQNFVATSTTATSTFAGGLDVGNGALVYDLNSGVTSIMGLQTGSMNFDTDAGAVSWIDLQVSTTTTSGLVESYTAFLDGQPGITVYGEADGSGNVNKVRVGIGTTSPTARLTVWASTTAATGRAFDVIDNASTTLFSILDNGYVGIGTSSPYAKLSVAGEALAGFFTATTTTATSTFLGGVTLGGTTGFNFNPNNSNNVTIGGLFNNTSKLAIIGTASENTFSASVLGVAGIPIVARFESAANQAIDRGASAGWYVGNGSNLVGGGRLGGELRVANAANSGSGSYMAFVTENTSGSLIEGMRLDASQRLGIGTTSPYAKLSVAGETVAQNFTATSTTATSSFAGGLNVGSGALVYDLNSGVTTINALETGALRFDTDAGMVSWMDLSVASSSSGVVNSYTAHMDGQPMITVYGISDGVGGASSTRVAIGTTTPAARLTVWSSGMTNDTRLFDVINSASSTMFTVLENGNVGIATTTPYAKLSVAGTVVGQNFVATSTTATSTFAGGLDVGSGSIVYDLNSGLTTISGLQAGPMVFDTNAGQVSWIDLDVSTTSSSGVIQSYTANMDGQPALTVYGEADGSGNVNKVRVGIGTTSPTARLTIWASTTAATGMAFNVVDFASTTLFTVLDSGNVGIGTTSPYAKLSVAGEVAAGFFTATTTTATTTLAGGLNVGSGGLVYDLNSGITTITGLQTGAMSFDTDAGQVVWTDLAVGTTTVSGMIESYTAQMDGQPALTIYGEADGNGGTNKVRVAVGTTSPSARLTVWASSTSATLSAFNVISSASSTLFTVMDDGKAGFSTTSPWRTLSVTGSVGFDGLTTAAGSPDALCLSSTKEVTVNTGAQTCTVSSARFKHDITYNAAPGLNTLLALKPVVFKYNNTDNERIGLIAEDVQSVDPRLTFTEYASTTVRGVRYEDLTVLAVNSIQNLSAILGIDLSSGTSTAPVSVRLDTIESRLTNLENGGGSGLVASVSEWVGNKISATLGYFKQLTVGDANTPTAITVYDKNGQAGCMMVDDVTTGAFTIKPGACGQPSQVSPSTPPANTSTSTPVTEPEAAPADTEAPVITVQGNNPANVTVGTTYVDLGATVTDNAGSNIGIKARVNGGEPVEIGQISIDTSVAGEHTIVYEATDAAGNKGTAERKVIVGQASPSVEEVPSQTATSTEAN